MQRSRVNARCTIPVSRRLLVYKFDPCSRRFKQQRILFFWKTFSEQLARALGEGREKRWGSRPLWWGICLFRWWLFRNQTSLAYLEILVSDVPCISLAQVSITGTRVHQERNCGLSQSYSLYVMRVVNVSWRLFSILKLCTTCFYYHAVLFFSPVAAAAWLAGVFCNSYQYGQGSQSWVAEKRYSDFVVLDEVRQHLMWNDFRKAVMPTECRTPSRSILDTDVYLPCAWLYTWCHSFLIFAPRCHWFINSFQTSANAGDMCFVPVVLFRIHSKQKKALHGSAHCRFRGVWSILWLTLPWTGTCIDNIA